MLHPQTTTRYPNSRIGVSSLRRTWQPLFHLGYDMTIDGRLTYVFVSKTNHYVLQPPPQSLALADVKGLDRSRRDLSEVLNKNPLTHDVFYQRTILEEEFWRLALLAAQPINSLLMCPPSPVLPMEPPTWPAGSKILGESIVHIHGFYGASTCRRKGRSTTRCIRSQPWKVSYPFHLFICVGNHMTKGSWFVPPLSSMPSLARPFRVSSTL